MSKRIFIDLDGTLLKDDLSITLENSKAIVKALDAGYDVVLTSGRPILFVNYIASKIDSRVNCIGFNGAFYNDVSLAISEKYLEKLFMQAQNLNIKLMFKSYDCIYCNSKINDRFLYPIDDDSIVKYHEFVKYEVIKQTNIYKILGIYGEYDDTFINNLVDDKSINLESYHKKGFEITNKNANKGHATKQYCAYNNCDASKQYYFGDAINDISMFKNNGFNYVMSQAISDVLLHATYICDNYENTGVAHGINRILEGEK